MRAIRAEKPKAIEAAPNFEDLESRRSNTPKIEDSPKDDVVEKKQSPKGSTLTQCEGTLFNSNDRISKEPIQMDDIPTADGDGVQTASL